MISCTDFIPAYSELFSFLEDRGGKPAVVDFWNYLSRVFLTNLRDLVAANGIRGCWLYWNHTLNEEAADFTMELDEETGEFSITMHLCPSKGRLLKSPDITQYHDYCGHCEGIYRQVLEPLGLDYQHDRSQTDRASCRLTVRRR